ncbi:hypothetical protein MCAP1_002688 [Malassezia caprae]|uniref:Uncharacterized protein n=1 Tax=Malassezia caprae TaxID=1381934 RepID=A0AAF0E8W7_9BASI|nr:hypothetical protein MCAP1_002688 [Malassezia caprae]
MAAGLRRSARAVRRSKADDSEPMDEKSMEEMVALDAKDATRLVTIMDRYAYPLTASVMPGVLDRQGGAKTLRAMLTAPSPNAVEIWKCAASLCGAAARTDARDHMGVLLLLHLLGQLLPSLSTAGAVQAQLHAENVALHMQLPAGDYFTNAVALTDSARAALDTGAADGVAVAPPMDVPPLYTLGDCATVAKPLAKHKEPRTMHAASYLSYGAFGSSLGPSVDSSGKTLDATSTDTIYTARHRIARRLHGRWGAPLAARLESAYRVDSPAQEPMDEDEVAAHTLAAEAAALDPELDATLLEQALEALDVDQILHENRLRLEELQELQWARTRMDYAQASSAHVDERERELAEDVLGSLTDLLLHVPPSAVATTARAAGPMVLLTQVVLASSLTPSSALSHGFYGTLSLPVHGAKTQAQLPDAHNPNALPMWAPLLRPSTVADNATAQPGADARILAYAWDQAQASPAQAVKAAMGPGVPHAPGMRPVPMPAVGAPPPGAPRPGRVVARPPY